MNELFDTFHKDYSISKYLLIIYSPVIGLIAKTILDVGIGSTTKTPRNAATMTGGSIFSIDIDKVRFSKFKETQNDFWNVHIGQSDKQVKENRGTI